MEITFRKAHPEEHDACVDLVNYVFSHDHCPHDFEKMIPRVYGPGKNARAVPFKQSFLRRAERSARRKFFSEKVFTARGIDSRQKKRYNDSE